MNRNDIIAVEQLPNMWSTEFQSPALGRKEGREGEGKKNWQKTK
jgi:hypothetical protein